MRARHLALLVLLGCDDAASDVVDATESSSETGVAYTLSRAEYAFDWDYGEAELLGEGWQTTNDLGLTFTITAGYLNSYSTTLMPCDDGTEDEATASLLDWVVPRAWAGHSGETDASALEDSLVEALGDPQPVAFGAVDFDEATYCEAHYLTARVIGSSRELPDAVDMVGTALYLEGTWQRPGEEPVPFTVEDSNASGALLPLPAVDGVEGCARVTWTRRLDTMFDGIDPDDPPLSVGYAILDNLTDGASVALAPCE